jgi:hypothetical protein
VAAKPIAHRARKTKENCMIDLGSEVCDSVSGFKGIAMAQHMYINGCARITVQPKVDKEGKLPETQTFDESQLVVVSKQKIKGKNDTGGPEKYTDVRRY